MDWTFICWLRNYLSERKQVTKVNGTKSEVMLINCGVPQGSILGPLIVILYINKLPEALEDSDTYLYADDTAIICKGKTLPEVHGKLDLQLTRAITWLNNHKLTLNLKRRKSCILAQQTRQTIYTRKL